MRNCQNLALIYFGVIFFRVEVRGNHSNIISTQINQHDVFWKFLFILYHHHFDHLILSECLLSSNGSNQGSINDLFLLIKEWHRKFMLTSVLNILTLWKLYVLTLWSVNVEAILPSCKHFWAWNNQNTPSTLAWSKNEWSYLTSVMFID